MTPPTTPIDIDALRAGVALLPMLHDIFSDHMLNGKAIRLLPQDFETIIAALETCKPLIAGGSVMVPREPTEAMLEAGDNEQKLDYDLSKVWKAMIAASLPIPAITASGEK